MADYTLSLKDIEKLADPYRSLNHSLFPSIEWDDYCQEIKITTLPGTTPSQPIQILYDEYVARIQEDDFTTICCEDNLPPIIIQFEVMNGYGKGDLPECVDDPSKQTKYKTTDSFGNIRYSDSDDFQYKATIANANDFPDGYNIGLAIPIPTSDGPGMSTYYPHEILNQFFEKEYYVSTDTECAIDPIYSPAKNRGCGLTIIRASISGGIVQSGTFITLVIKGEEPTTSVYFFDELTGKDYFTFIGKYGDGEVFEYQDTSGFDRPARDLYIENSGQFSISIRQGGEATFSTDDLTLSSELTVTSRSGVMGVVMPTDESCRKIPLTTTIHQTITTTMDVVLQESLPVNVEQLKTVGELDETKIPHNIYNGPKFMEPFAVNTEIELANYLQELDRQRIIDLERMNADIQQHPESLPVQYISDEKIIFSNRTTGFTYITTLSGSGSFVGISGYPPESYLNQWINVVDTGNTLEEGSYRSNGEDWIRTRPSFYMSLFETGTNYLAENDPLNLKTILVTSDSFMGIGAFKHNLAIFDPRPNVVMNSDTRPIFPGYEPIYSKTTWEELMEYIYTVKYPITNVPAFPNFKVGEHAINGELYNPLYDIRNYRLLGVFDVSNPVPDYDKFTCLPLSYLDSRMNIGNQFKYGKQYFRIVKDFYNIAPKYTGVYKGKTQVVAPVKTKFEPITKIAYDANSSISFVLLD